MTATAQKIAIVTDSAADIAAPTVAALNITVIHVPVVIDGRTYYEGVDLTAVDFASLTAATKETPTLAQVPLAGFEQTFSTLKTRGYTTVICVLTASGISSLVSTLHGYMNTVPGLAVHAFDSHTSGVSLAQMVHFAGLAAAKGCSTSQILAGLRQMRAAQHDIWVVSDMRNLLRTGYLQNGPMVFSNRMMRLKTLLAFNADGCLEAFDTQFRLKKAFQYVKEHIVPDYQNAALPLKICIAANSLVESGTPEWLEKLQLAFPQAHFAQGQIKPSLSVHTGSRAVIVSWGLDCHSVLEQIVN